jgi:hypothetical protein
MVLEEKEHLQDAYKSIEVVYAEKEADMQKRINDLIAWKEKATAQLKVLLELQKNSMSKDDYKSVSNELEVTKEKLAKHILREKEHLEKIAKLEINEREIFNKTEMVADKFLLIGRSNASPISLELLDKTT